MAESVKMTQQDGQWYVIDAHWVSASVGGLTGEVAGKLGLSATTYPFCDSALIDRCDDAEFSN